jgi:hypothetical protein
MHRGRVDGEKKSPCVGLHIGNSFSDAWSGVIRPWFESLSVAASGAEGLIGVITPFASHAHSFRNHLLIEGTSLLGVKFFSPSQLREILLRPTELHVPLREHLRLLLAISAEEFACRMNNLPDNAEEASRIAKSVARDPDHFLRVIDQLNAAGWSVDELRPEALRDIVREFETRVHGCGFDFVQAADRSLLAEADKRPPQFSHLLISGFDGAHWQFWPLLQAATRMSANVTVFLRDPRDEARGIDEAWVGTWEENFGAAAPINAAQAGSTVSFGELLRLPETDSERKDRIGKPIENVHFLVGRDTTEQARSIVALTSQFLRDTNCDRIGVLFPGDGALPRLVAAFLESARIAHNDGIAHLAPSGFDTEAWRLWLELQGNPRLAILLRFIRAAGADILGRIPVAQVEKALKNAYGAVLIDQVGILREYCRRHADREENTDSLRVLDKIEYIPGTGTFAEFLERTRKALNSLGWREHWSELDRASRNWNALAKGTFSRHAYLRWLGEILCTPTVNRENYGAHPYSRVHLLKYAQAEGQPWSHIIIAGLNEDAWPALDDSFVREQDIADFNQRNKALNRRALKTGRHGEGHWSVQANKTLFLGAAERTQIRRRQLFNLLDSVTTGIGATANLYSDAFPSRTANPSEFFSRLYFAARGRALSEKTLHALELETRSWLRGWSPADSQKVDAISVGRTRYAFDARRQSRPAGEYEFALRSPPSRPITLRVTQWEQALRSPAHVWMKVFLGVEADDEGGNVWPVATGQWVHQWLADSANTGNTSEFVDIASIDLLRTRLAEQARQFRDQVQDLSAASGKQLPDWWISGWGNALYIADCLAAKLSGLNDWSKLAVEWPLGTPAEIPIEENWKLRVRGRIDLILARGDPQGSFVPYPELWVVDYKTGRQRGFNLRELRAKESGSQKFRRQLIKGKGVQLALYALAVHALGAADVRLTVLGTHDDLQENFRLADALAQNDFWRELIRMQEQGIFGMIGSVHSEFGFARSYPLATLAIDPDLLEEKWAMTHPPFASAPEELEQ